MYTSMCLVSSLINGDREKPWFIASQFKSYRVSLSMRCIHSLKCNEEGWGRASPLFSRNRSRFGLLLLPFVVYSTGYDGRVVPRALRTHCLCSHQQSVSQSRHKLYSTIQTHHVHELRMRHIPGDRRISN